MNENGKSDDERDDDLDNVIFSYSRLEALQDGVLVDLNQWIPVRESGYKYPVACTAAVFELIKSAVKNKKYRNDHAGVVWDILWMSRMSPIKSWETGRLFQVIIEGAGKERIFNLKIEVGPGDDGEPVLTIMLPDED